MLDIAVDSARVVQENMKRAMASPVGIFMYAALSGMVGIVILLAFFSMLMSRPILAMILPVIISFNAASSGYCLIDKGGRDFPRLKISLIAISILLAGTGCFVLSVMLPWESMTEGFRYLVSGVSALIFAFFGAWIGFKSEKLKSSP